MAELSDTRIDIRTDQYRKQIIARAAELVGSNITQFIIDRVYPEAEKIVAEHDQKRLLLDERSWEAFCRKLDESPRELPNLNALLRSQSRFADD